MKETSKSRQYRSYDVDETVGKFLSTRTLQRHKSLQNLDSQRMSRMVPHHRLDRPSSANSYTQNSSLSTENATRRGVLDGNYLANSSYRYPLTHGDNAKHAPLMVTRDDFNRYDPQRQHASATFPEPKLADSTSMRSDAPPSQNRLDRDDRRRKSTMRSLRRVLRMYFGLSVTDHKTSTAKRNKTPLSDKREDQQWRRNGDVPRAHDQTGRVRSGSWTDPERNAISRNQSSVRSLQTGAFSSRRIPESPRMHEPSLPTRKSSFTARGSKPPHFDRSSVASSTYSRQKSASCMTLAKRGARSDCSVASTSGSEELRKTKTNARTICRSSASDFSSGADDEGVSSINADGSTPCLQGISNLGNTCYINSVLQCLSASSPLADYFISDKFLKDLHEKNNTQLENSQQYGTGGLLTLAFADLIKSLWSNDINERIAREFYEVVRQFNNEYATFRQQDAQEFLVWLLDKIHEDLNTAIVRLYNDKMICGSEEDVAESTRNNHLRAHCSVIITLFSAQFRSSIHCQRCGMQTLKFDPYMCVSLQVPQEIRRSVYVTVVYASARQPRLARYGIFVDRCGRLIDVNECISAVAKIPPEMLLMGEVDDAGFCSLMPMWTDIECLHSDKVSAIEIPHLGGFSSTDSTEFLAVIFLIVEVHERSKHKAKQRFKQPFACVMPRYSSFDEICASVFNAMRCVLRSEPPERRLRSAIIEFRDCRICVPTGCGSCEELNHLVSMPFYTDVVERAIAANRTLSKAVAVLQLCVEVTQPFVHTFLKSDPEEVFIDQSSDVLRENSKSTPLTLTECLDEFSSPECIEWKCENCGMNAGEKILKFRSLPPLLVFHLKRFRQVDDGTMVKLNRAIHFPVEGLDMSPYVLSCSQVFVDDEGQSSDTHYTHGDVSSSHSKLMSCSESNIQRLYTHEGCLYDLFAVVHHIGGTVNSGHYTASTKNAVDGQWRAYDDRVVRTADPIEIAKCSNAYLLFYEKRINQKNSKRIPIGQCSNKSVEQRDRLNVAAVNRAESSPSVSTMNALKTSSIGEQTILTSGVRENVLDAPRIDRHYHYRNGASTSEATTALTVQTNGQNVAGYSAHGIECVVSSGCPPTRIASRPFDNGSSHHRSPGTKDGFHATVKHGKNHPDDMRGSIPYRRRLNRQNVDSSRKQSAYTDV
uniref:ubiquitinyl hydrolase 1 n=1 Tax=Parascaris univalens TaxID=6257 RepID=A0A914ZK85_PARUN